MINKFQWHKKGHLFVLEKEGFTHFSHPCIVQKRESYKYSLSQKQKSIESGCRKVKYKTNFPILFRLILNPFVFYPFHIMQKLFTRHANCMVIYSELGLIKNEKN